MCIRDRATNTTDYNFTVTAARGDIVDSAGRRIAASTTSYNVVLSKLLMGGEDLDAMLQRIVGLDVYKRQGRWSSRSWALPGWCWPVS